MVHVVLNLAWRILSITLLACEMSAIVWYFERSLALPFFGIGMKTDIGEWSYHHGYLVIKIFLYSSSVYPYHLVLISSASIN